MRNLKRTIFLVIISIFFISNSSFPQGDYSGDNIKLKSAILSTIFPGLGQMYSRKHIKGIVFISTGAILLGASLYTGLYSQGLWIDYEYWQTEDNYKRYKARAEKWVPTANILIGVTITFWTYNIIDAYISANNE